MPFTPRQLELIERHLYPDEAQGEQPVATIKVSRRDLRFLLQAIQYYHDTCCPGLGEGDECAGLGWAEDVHSGALETACYTNCQQWVEDLLSDEILANFPPRAATK